MPGPVPKRSDERRRRNKPAASVDRVPAGRVIEPPATPTGLHPIAERWFESLKTSGQSQFYEPSDWALAEYVANVMSKNLKQRKFSATLFATVLSAMTDLLTTESARRKARIEVEREQQEPGEAPGVTAINDYRKRLGAG